MYKMTTSILAAINCIAPSASKISKPIISNHIQMVQELKQYFAKHASADKFAPQSQTMTPTQAYLSVPRLNALVHKDWKNELVDYKDMFDEIKKKEHEFNDTHYVFYHGQNDAFRLLHDFLNALYEELYLHPPLDDFYMMRLWYESREKAHMNKFIEEYEGGSPITWSDQGGPLVKELLSVNFSIFGNTNTWGECTLKAFTRNRSYFFHSVMPLIEDVFKEFGFDKKYLKDLAQLPPLIATKEGTIYQIFIPKNLVDSCAYVCHRWATPYRQPLVTSDFNAQKQRHMHIKPIVDAYKQKPNSFVDLDILQARLLFSQDILLNPNSGVKIFRYTTVPQAKLEDYKKKLKKITHDIYNDWLPALTKNSIAQNKLLARMPLGILLRNMLK